MSIREIKERLILIGTLFCTGAVLYGILALTAHFSGDLSIGLCFIIAALGGWLFGGILAGIFMFASFIKEKNLAFKMAACIFFPITVSAVVFGGIMCLIPYVIHNLKRLRRH